MNSKSRVKRAREIMEAVLTERKMSNVRNHPVENLITRIIRELDGIFVSWDENYGGEEIKP